MAIPAIVAAGDRGAAKAVFGESKVFLEIAGRPLVAHVVDALQQVPEVSEVWVVGDANRLAGVFGGPEAQARLTRPLHVVGQLSNLYENAWEGFRRSLPDAGPNGRDPEGDADADQRVLYVSGDLPFATPQEISDFIARSLAVDCDYALGLVTEESMQDFRPAEPGAPGVVMASFNLREGRFRQSNLHLVRPARIGNRHYIQEMYQHRHQREFGEILSLAWTLLTSERGGPTVIWYYALMHMAGAADRVGWRGLADRLRRFIPLARIEKGCSELLRTRFRFVVTEGGGCAIDIDTEADCEAARSRFDAWTAQQAERVERLLGPVALPERSAARRE